MAIEMYYMQAARLCIDAYTGRKDRKYLELSYNKLFGIGEWKGPRVTNTLTIKGQPVEVSIGCYNLPTHLMVHELTTDHIETLKHERLKEGLKKTSINAEISFWRKVYRYARDVKGVLTHMPQPVFTTFKLKDKQRFVSRQEEDEILRKLDYYIETHRAKYGRARSWEVARDLYLFLVDSGVRVSEALDVRMADIDFDEWIIKVFRSKTQDSGEAHGVVKPTRRMKVVIERRSKEALKRTDALFMRPNRAVKYLRLVISEVCNADPIQIQREGTATIHSLRDTFGSRLANADMSLYTISKLLGHTNTTMTRKYARIEQERASRKAAETLDEILSRPTNSRF